MLIVGTLWRPRTKQKREYKRSLHMEILKTGVLHKEICVQSLWETVKCRDKGKNKRMLHKDAFLRMCGVKDIQTHQTHQNLLPHRHVCVHMPVGVLTVIIVYEIETVHAYCLGLLRKQIYVLGNWACA